MNKNQRSCQSPKSPKVAEEKPKRQRKARAKPTKQELIKFFQDSMNELKQIVSELNEEEVKIRGLQLKQLPLLINETLQNLDEDMKEFEEEIKNIEASPDEQVQPSQ